MTLFSQLNQNRLSTGTYRKIITAQESMQISSGIILNSAIKMNTEHKQGINLCKITWFQDFVASSPATLSQGSHHATEGDEWCCLPSSGTMAITSSCNKWNTHKDSSWLPHLETLTPARYYPYLYYILKLTNNNLTKNNVATLNNNTNKIASKCTIKRSNLIGIAITRR